MSSPLNKCVSLGGWRNVLPNTQSNYRASLPGAGNPWTVPNESGPVEPVPNSDPPRSEFSEELPFTMVQEIADLGVTHVKFWVSWKELAEAINGAPSVRHPHALGRAPETFEEQALFMDTTKGHTTGLGYLPDDDPFIPDEDEPLIRYLDQSIREANNHGLKVILTVEQAAPSWSRVVSQTAPQGWTPYQHFPDDLTADSPYGWFIRYLVARYTGDETGGPGCGCIPAIGNLSGARINFIEPLNEPNFAWWPQVVDDGQSVINQSSCKASQAMTTCEWWCRFYSTRYDPDFNPTILDGHWANVVTVLGPSGADFSQTFEDSNGIAKNTPWDDFTAVLLSLLAEWPVVMRVGWAHHNYGDIEEERPFVGGGGELKEPRVYALAGLLEQYGFLAGASYNTTYPLQQDWGREIWLTEGTYRMGQGKADKDDLKAYGELDPLDDSQPVEGQPRGERQIRQRRAIKNNFELMRDTPRADAVLWTQHEICEDLDPLAIRYVLREDMRRATIKGPGRRRLAWFAFRDLVP